jgi:T-complex protein 1 subunit epsilon
MSLAFDENGRPFIILREQEKKKRVKGLEAHKVRIHTLIQIYDTSH